MDERARHQWIATHILPHEGEARGWLRRHMHTLAVADIDDVIQEAYARLWLADFSQIGNGRSYLYTVIRNLLLKQARRARIVPMERLGEIEALRIPTEERAGSGISDTGISGILSGHDRREVHAKTEVHPNQVTSGKSQALENLAVVEHDDGGFLRRSARGGTQDVWSAGDLQLRRGRLCSPWR